MKENVRRETVKIRERGTANNSKSPLLFFKSQQQLQQHHVTINVELEKQAPMRINCMRYHFTFSLMNRRRPYNVQRRTNLQYCVRLEEAAKIWWENWHFSKTIILKRNFLLPTVALQNLTYFFSFYLQLKYLAKKTFLLTLLTKNLHPFKKSLNNRFIYANEKDFEQQLYKIRKETCTQQIYVTLYGHRMETQLFIVSML